MPRKSQTEEQRIARYAYQLKSHHRKVDNIVKLGVLFLGEKAKSMELKDVLAGVREELVRRNPGHHNRNNDAYLCRTLEYDNIRASVWVSSNMTQNRAIFERKIAALKQGKEIAEAKVREKMVKLESKQMEHQPDEFEQVRGEHHEEIMEVDIDEAEDLETMHAAGEYVSMRYQPRGSEEYFYGEPHMDNMETMALVGEAFEEPQQYLHGEFHEETMEIDEEPEESETMPGTRQLVPMEHQPPEFQAVVTGEPLVEAMATRAVEPQKMPAVRELEPGEYEEYIYLQPRTVTMAPVAEPHQMTFWEKLTQDIDQDTKRYRESC